MLDLSGVNLLLTKGLLRILFNIVTKILKISSILQDTAPFAFRYI